jgi:dipeptidyl-peptidase III
MMKCLLQDGGGVLRIDCDHEKHTLTARLDKSKLLSHGKPALVQMLLRLHMYRCTAKVADCRTYYEDLSRVDGEYLEWRRTVLQHRPPHLIYVQANTSLSNDEVMLQEYESTVEGIIQSWSDRKV